ncbi:MAG: Bax inhibitor-1/YccA family protein [Actinomycetota bacterium]
MSNPVFERMRDSRGYATFGPRGAARAPMPPAPSPADLESMYAQPAATTVDTGRMSYDDVIVKTALTLATVLAGAVVGWQVPSLMLVGLIGGFVLALVNTFKRNPSPILILAYAALEGLFLGGISFAFENANFGGESGQGIVAQATLATFCVFGAVLVGFRSGKLRATPKLNRIFFIAMAGYLLFSLVNLGLMFFAGNSSLRSGTLGLVIGAFAVLLASYALVMDFEFIKAGVEQGAPAKFAWTAAFGLTVTLVWLYIEILRILSILRGD